MSLDVKLENWAKFAKNVALIGKHGVGKTSKIKACWDRLGLRGKYFNAINIDPWANFIGIPDTVTDEEGRKVTDFIPPKWVYENIDAIFIDEYNRSKPAMRNGVMELIQFKSINGIVIPNLKMVWVAMNPSDGDYQVDEPDKAQLDRFHITYEVPYELDKVYFANKFGEELAGHVYKWWNNASDTVKEALSPRRMDYIIEWHLQGGDIAEMMPDNTNPDSLLSAIGGMDFEKTFLNSKSDGVRLGKLINSQIMDYYTLILLKPWLIGDTHTFLSQENVIRIPIDLRKLITTEYSIIPNLLEHYNANRKKTVNNHKAWTNLKNECWCSILGTLKLGPLEREEIQVASAILNAQSPEAISQYMTGVPSVMLQSNLLYKFHLKLSPGQKSDFDFGAKKS